MKIEKLKRVVWELSVGEIVVVKMRDLFALGYEVKSMLNKRLIIEIDETRKDDCYVELEK